MLKLSRAENFSHENVYCSAKEHDGPRGPEESWCWEAPRKQFVASGKQMKLNPSLVQP